jgi:hypothetical protein
MELYPNVTIEVSNQSWDDYWTKLTVNVPAGQGPALWHMHTSKLTEFCDGGLMDPMPSTVADQDFLNSHWVAFSEGAMDCPTGVVGSRNFLPMGTMMPLLYINKKLWVEAGLTDNDVPKSWEDLRNVAKALTKTDSAGRVIQAGLQASWQEWLQNSIYQQGRYLFTEDGKRVQMNNDEYVRAVQLIKDLQTVDKVHEYNGSHNSQSHFLLNWNVYPGTSGIPRLVENNESFELLNQAGANPTYRRQGCHIFKRPVCFTVIHDPLCQRLTNTGQGRQLFNCRGVDSDLRYRSIGLSLCIGDTAFLNSFTDPLAGCLDNLTGAFTHRTGGSAHLFSHLAEGIAEALLCLSQCVTNRLSIGQTDG